MKKTFSANVIELSDSDDDLQCEIVKLNNHRNSQEDDKSKNCKIDRSKSQKSASKGKNVQNTKLSNAKPVTRKRKQENSNTDNRIKRKSFVNDEAEEKNVKLEETSIPKASRQLLDEKLSKVNSGHCVEWTELDYIREIHNVDKQTAQNAKNVQNTKLSTAKPVTRKRKQENSNTDNKIKRKSFVNDEAEEKNVKLEETSIPKASKQLLDEKLSKVNSGHCVEWTELDYIREIHNVDKQTAQNAKNVQNTKLSTAKPVTRKRKQENSNTDNKIKRKSFVNDEAEEKNVKLEEISIPKASKQFLDEKLSKVNSGHCVEWTELDYIREIHNVDKQTAQNVINLFNEDNTIPFIARYRKYMTNGMEADELRALKNSLDQAKAIQQRASAIIKAIDKSDKWTPEVHALIRSTKRLDDLEHIYSLFKSQPKGSLAERARKVGLETASYLILNGENLPSLSSMINKEVEGLQNEQQIHDGIVHIIADVMSKDKYTFEKVKDLQNNSNIEIQTSQTKKCQTSEKKKSKNLQGSKYEMYLNFRANVRTIKPHQILAINRAESQKIVNVKIVVPDSLGKDFTRHCFNRYRKSTVVSKFHTSVISESIEHAYKKLIKPLIVRRIRNDLKKNAETASIDVFAVNVKQLLLSPPIRGKVVLGIDPGFFHGCKLAVVSERGDVLETAVIFPHKDAKSSKQEARKTLSSLVKKHKCQTFALGNGTACRQTEEFVTTLIESGEFKPLNVSYAIVDEAGASIYSCSGEAKLEFPDLDVNLVSAISIARRLQDPMAELVKVEPKHLGVGMYQHDLPEKQLLLSLNEVVSEAVSFVGVDINTASQSLLKRVAGFNASRASNVIEWRSKHGPFRNREQLLGVKGIGKKTYEQCAGFTRILPETATLVEDSSKTKAKKRRNEDLNPLDGTWIHPESYKIAYEFIKRCNCPLEDLGTQDFIKKIRSFAEKGFAELAKLLDAKETTVSVIVEALTMKKDEDIRSNNDLPMFHNSMKTIDDLSIDAKINGVVRNVTHFGAFVDVGVGKEGLIPTKFCKNRQLHIGQRVEVRIKTIERERSRICLELMQTF